jgi:two-component system chemotaxis sensor kinase CheA
MLFMTGSTPSASDVFFQEAIELLEDLEAALLDLEGEQQDAELVNRAFRSLHTIKGSGAMFGFEDVARFTHVVENAFQQVRDGHKPITADLLAATLDAGDHIRDLLLRQDISPERGERLQAFFQAFCSDDPAQEMAVSSSADSGEKGDSQEHADAVHGSRGVWHIRIKLPRQLMVFGANPLALLAELHSLGECIVVGLPDGIPHLDQLDPLSCYMEWDVFLTTEHPKSVIDDVFLFVIDDAEILITPLDAQGVSPLLGEILVNRGDIDTHVIDDLVAMQRPLGQLLVTSGAASSERVVSALVQQREIRKVAATPSSSTPAGGASSKDAGQNSVRVQAERLDGLMDLVGELVIAQARLRQLSVHSDDVNLRAISEEIERLATDLRDTTMSIRMLPIGTLFNRFRRVIRDLSQSLSKDVTLTTDGDDAELDKTIIERLNDPLVHLVRNAIDHGLETADERRAAGKPPGGTVHLSAVHSGGQVLITISDDGRGMDHEAIRAKAEASGLTTPEAVLTENEILNFIFHPGFSTAKKISAVSGRGVGLDVVKRTIDSLRGTINITSSPGRGAKMTLCLPLTLAIIDGLLVRVGDGRYVIPLAAIEECVELPDRRTKNQEGLSFLNMRGRLIPYLHLKEVFGVEGEEDPYQKVVIVAFGDDLIGLVVDQVIGQYQTVIKSLSKILSDVREFSGATILGDGSVALIVDIPRLVELGQKGRDGPRSWPNAEVPS